jgi:Fe-S-cluster containining protein
VAEERALRESFVEPFNASLHSTTCLKGCAHCCHWPISISSLEGLLIYDWLVERLKWRSFKNKATEAADLVTGLTHEVWLYSQRPCVFLAPDKTCYVYPVRPLACRTSYSIGDPDECQPHEVARSKTVVPRMHILMAFHVAEEALLKRFGGKLVTMPIPTAVLVAARLREGLLGDLMFDAATFLEHMGRLP